VVTAKSLTLALVWLFWQLLHTARSGVSTAQALQILQMNSRGIQVLAISRGFAKVAGMILSWDDGIRDTEWG